MIALIAEETERSIEKISRNIELSIRDFENENKREPTKAFLPTNLLRKLSEGKKLIPVGKQTEKCHQGFFLNADPNTGVKSQTEFYEQAKLFNEEKISNKRLISLLKTLDKPEYLTLATPGKISRKLKYIAAYNIMAL